MEPVQISSAASGSPPGRRVGGGATFRVSSAMRKELQDPLVCMTPRNHRAAACSLSVRINMMLPVYTRRVFRRRYCFILELSRSISAVGTASYYVPVSRSISAVGTAHTASTLSVSAVSTDTLEYSQ